MVPEDNFKTVDVLLNDEPGVNEQWALLPRDHVNGLEEVSHLSVCHPLPLFHLQQDVLPLVGEMLVFRHHFSRRCYQPMTTLFLETAFWCPRSRFFAAAYFSFDKIVGLRGLNGAR